jgi:hypothetical protein
VTQGLIDLDAVDAGEEELATGLALTEVADSEVRTIAARTRTLLHTSILINFPSLSFIPTTIPHTF